jgi:hypothetical protein
MEGEFPSPPKIPMPTKILFLGGHILIYGFKKFHHAC